ncbi:MAG: CerR family C-terminal domain-containing protein [Halieaceae bacterium]|nr:CerR family C-terminal domain-containing protein [Halieaceae bacterium]
MNNPKRGDATREALIQAAIDVFGHDGFDASSTRRIANAAGVNQAAIGYHFGGKQGLYEAVFGHIVSQMQIRMVPVAERAIASLELIQGSAAERRHMALDLLDLVFSAFIDLFGEESATGWVRLVLREQQDPTPAFHILYDGLMGRMLRLVTHLVSVASGLDEASEACRVRTSMLLGQVLVFHVARGTTSPHLNWNSLGQDQLTLLKQQFRIALEAQFPRGVST